MNLDTRQKSDPAPQRADRKAVLVTVAAFLCSALLCFGFLAFLEHHQEGEARAVADNTSEVYLRTLNQTLNQALSATYALAALIREGNGEIQDFEGTARELLALYPGTTALQLAPDGIIRQSVPLAGNEKAIGHNLLSDPERNKEAFLARDTGKLTLAGPFNLIQGGVAAIGRFPVFLADQDGGRHFWGFTTAMLGFPEVLETAGMQQLQKDGYHYELWRIHPDTGKKQVIAASGGEALVDPVENSLEVPNGTWTLSIMPTQGWHEPVDLWAKIITGLLVSVLFTALIFFLQRQPQLLRRQVALRTRELQRSEERCRSIIELAADSILLGSPEGLVIGANQSAVELTGYEANELIGLRIDQLFPEGVGKAGPPGLEIFGKSRERLLRRKDGSQVSVEMSSRQMPDGTYQAIIRDVTDRKLMEETQRQLQEEIVKSQRLESLGLLAGGIAHDFNNILTGILGNITLANRLVGDQHQAHPRLAACEKAVTKAADLTKQLLTFSKGGEPFKSQLDTRSILQESISFALHGSNVRGVLEAEEDLWFIQADAGQMHQLFNNLLINAMQAMPEGGVIRLRAENLVLGNHEAENLPPGQYVKVSVVDEGIGIPAENLPFIFDPYFTTKATGSGLGLASCFSIVKRHGGKISAASATGDGTTITLFIPAGRPPAERIEESVTVARPTERTRTILLMDDEDYIRDIACAMLEELGYRVECCADGNEAVRLHRAALRKGEGFDALILDLTVPGGMGGQEAAARIRDADPEVPMIVSSGYSNEATPVGEQNELFNDSLAKPYTIAQMKEVLTRLLAG